jgi:uncharacterized protein YidB (DUF937 family)
MGLFDILETTAGQFVGDKAHAALAQSPLGHMTGLLAQLRQGGLVEMVQTWTQGGQLKGALADEHVKSLAAQLGPSPDVVLATLAQHLPGLAAANAAQ